MICIHIILLASKHASYLKTLQYHYGVEFAKQSPRLYALLVIEIKDLTVAGYNIGQTFKTPLLVMYT